MTRQLPRQAIVFVIIVLTFGVLVILTSLRNATSLTHKEVITLILLTLTVFLTDTYRVELTFKGDLKLCMSTVATFGAVILFPKQCSIVAIGALAADILLRQPLIKSSFNWGQWAIATGVSGYVWYKLREHIETVSDASYFFEPRNIAVVILTAIVFLLINVSLVITIVSIVNNLRFTYLLKNGLSGIVTQLLIQPALGLLIAVLYTLNPLSIVLVMSPLAAVYYSLRNFENFRKQTLETIERLSDILDKRDPQTDQHSRRVAHYVRLICEELNLPSEVVETIVSAARVHDLGKIGIPDAVLLKPGKLTDEEWELIRKHPEYGEDILSPLSAYEECLPAIRHHHERWDGMGYPDGLAGEDIPLGARIIAVADTYDAMVSSRPYRKGADKPDALLEIRRQAGKQFDPKVVEAFLKVMENRAEVAMPISINVAFDKQANT